MQRVPAAHRLLSHSNSRPIVIEGAEPRALGPSLLAFLEGKHRMKMNPQFFRNTDIDDVPGLPRELVGYGEHPPRVRWRNGAKVAVQVGHLGLKPADVERVVFPDSAGVAGSPLLLRA